MLAVVNSDFVMERVPSPPTFGPEFSSDNAGDGPVISEHKRPRMAQSDSDLTVTFTADSGCSHHMVSTAFTHLFSNPRESTGTISTASDSTLSITSVGRLGPLRDVLGVEGLSASLLSIRQACDEGSVVVFDRAGVKFYPSGSIHPSCAPILSGNVNSDGLYSIRVDTQTNNNHHAFLTSVQPSNAYTLWHQRFAHLSHRVLFNMFKHGSAAGMQFDTKEQFQRMARDHNCKGLCQGCVYAKMTRAPQSRRAKAPPDQLRPEPGRLIFADVLFSPTTSVRGHLTCALLLVDCDTKYLWVYPMRSKGEAPHYITQWLAWMEAHGKTVKAMTTLRTDNGTEFVNAELDRIIATNRLKRTLAAPYAHCHTAERAIRTVQTTARSMLLAANITPGFWAEGLCTAVYTLNRITTSTNRTKTRYELFHGVKPSVANLRTFGCEA
jgi:hypothetical protein